MPVGLRHTPIQSGRLKARMPECTRTKIVRVVPRRRTGERWYEVEAAVNGEKQVGFVRGRDLTEISCIG